MLTKSPDEQGNKFKSKLSGKKKKKEQQLCYRSGLMRKLLQLSLSPKPKCQNLTATTNDARSLSGTLPYTIIPRPHSAAAIYAGKQKLCTEPVLNTALIQIIVSHLCAPDLKTEVQTAKEA